MLKLLFPIRAGPRGDFEIQSGLDLIALLSAKTATLLNILFTGVLLSPVSNLTRNKLKSKPATFSGSYKYAPNFNCIPPDRGKKEY
jgi:hypothetical protein